MRTLSYAFFRTGSRCPPPPATRVPRVRTRSSHGGHGGQHRSTRIDRLVALDQVVDQAQVAGDEAGGPSADMDTERLIQPHREVNARFRMNP